MAVVEEDEPELMLPPVVATLDTNTDGESRPRSAMSVMSSVSEEVTEIMQKLKKVSSNPSPVIQDSLKLFVQEWKHQTTKEVQELEKLKKRVQKRKVIRAEEEKTLAEMRQKEEELRIQEAEETKIRKQQEKLKRIEEAERKRQKLLEEEKEQKRNFTIVSTGRETKQEDLRREPTKEEIEAMKQAALSVRIKPLGIDGLHKERLKRRAKELWEQLVGLETERYDLEEKAKRQEYDFKELKERQKIQLRHRAMKLGLPPEALMGKYPPKIMVASKYERRSGLKPFGETKDLFEGGFVKQIRETRDKTWQERQDLFTKRGTSEEVPPWLVDMPRRTNRIENVKEDDNSEGEEQEVKEEEQEVKEEEVEESGENEEEAAGEEEEEVEESEEVEVEEEETEKEEAKEEEIEEEAAGEEEEEEEPENPNVILEDPEGEAKAEAEVEEDDEEDEEEEEEDD